MLNAVTTRKFKRDVDKLTKQKKNLKSLRDIMKLLIEEKPLDQKHLDHPLKGEWKNCRDCHVENDLVLIYRIVKSSKTIYFERIGSHSELFG